MPKCKVAKCNNEGIIFFGTSIVCGECLNTLIIKEQEAKNKLLEDL